MITVRKWWGKLLFNVVWGFSDTSCYADRVLNLIPENFSGKLLDIPTGTGALTALKYSQLKTAEIICADYSEKMLDVAKARFAELKNINFIQADVGAMPFEDDFFDVGLIVPPIKRCVNFRRIFVQIQGKNRRHMSYAEDF
jgi:ubiquinone/menaquinone biosynthesis C-methylase UbiE